jgi:acetyl-CoA carboxylase carboxyl transferase subunit alpha
MQKSAEFYSLEKGILSLKEQIDALAEIEDLNKKEKIAALRAEIEKEWAAILPGLTTINIVQIARHPKRPYTLDYIAFLFQDFMEMHGDRRFADDPAIVAGLAFYKGRTVAVIGHQKGRTTRARIDRNFGQANPEGYRKALRVMQEAEKFGFPVITLIDTPGAYPGIGAGTRQAEAIAFNLTIALLKTPSSTSSSARGAAGARHRLGDQLMMLEHPSIPSSPRAVPPSSGRTRTPSTRPPRTWASGPKPSSASASSTRSSPSRPAAPTSTPSKHSRTSISISIRP